MHLKRIHITGASGAGVSTAGRGLAAHFDCAWFDTDDYYWMPTVPPYREKRPVPDRLRLLADDLDRAGSWVLSGSLDGWGDDLAARFDIAVFLYVPPALRLKRLRARERARFGAALDPGGPMHQQHLDFLEWSAGYDTGAHTGGRTLQRHRDWLGRLPCPVLRIEGELATDQIGRRYARRAASSRNGLDET